jgi:hypothetical protein
LLIRVLNQGIDQKLSYIFIEKNPDDPFAYVILSRAHEENEQHLLAKEACEKGYETAVSTSHLQAKCTKTFLDKISEKKIKE